MCKVEINDEFSIKIYITDLRTLPTFKITINSHLQMDINNTPTITKPTITKPTNQPIQYKFYLY